MAPSALVVDDEPATGAALKAILGILGYQAQSALTGLEARWRVHSAVPDVVLLDMMLPDLHGLEVCRGWKAEPTTALLPVIVVSARLASHNRAECFRSGACEFVPKPFTIDQIQNALKHAADWAAGLAHSTLAGALPLAPDKDHVFHQQLNRIRSTLVARGGNLAHVVRIIEAIESMRDHAISPHLGDAAAASFTLGPTTLAVSFATENLPPAVLPPHPFLLESETQCIEPDRHVFKTSIEPN